MNLTRIPVARLTAAVVAGVLLVGGSVSSRSHWDGSSSDVDLTAAAHADVGRTAVDESRARTVTVSRDGHARATATSSSVCEGCSGRAATVQVAYVPRGGIAADNVAAAWATGVSGTATAVSVQVVVQRPRTDVAATNRAIAVNTDCTGCTTDSVAVQIVVLSRLDRKVSRQVQSMLQDFAEVLGTPVPHGPRLRERGYHHGYRHASYAVDPTTTPSVVTAALTVPATLAAGAAASWVGADATPPEQAALDALIAQLQKEFGQDTVTVDVDTAAG